MTPGAFSAKSGGLLGRKDEKTCSFASVGLRTSSRLVRKLTGTRWGQARHRRTRLAHEAEVRVCSCGHALDADRPEATSGVMGVFGDWLVSGVQGSTCPRRRSKIIWKAPRGNSCLCNVRP